MKNMKQKIIVVVGPTSSGKSDLAVRLAKKYNGEVISADSRQVYKGLNIGTGKITKKEMCGVPHYLLDVANPKKRFTAQQYKKKAQRAVDTIIKKNKLPIVAGGTGFYIDTLLGTVSIPEVPPNEPLRKRLEKKSIETLFKQLKKLDKKRASTIDTCNKRRLIRAIEIAKVLGKVPKAQKQISGYDVLKIGIEVEKENLKKKIRKRLLARMKSGMVAEVRKLHAGGLSWRRMDELGLEYRYISRYLKGGAIEKGETIEKLQTAIFQYVKRQNNWFRRDKDIKWFKLNEYKKIERAVAQFLKN